MKLTTKKLAIVYLLILSIGTILSLYIPKNEVTASEAVVIPKEAIRLRILANSDVEADQAVKRIVRDEVNANITKWVQNLTSKDEARTLIQSKLPEVQKIAEAVVEKQGVNQSVKVEFGKVQFPTKLYGQFLYPAGEYEAILITLGEGKGANWWCVLYPPLCFLDFSNGVAVSDGFEDKKQMAASAVTVSNPTPVKTEIEPAVRDEVENEPIVKKEIQAESVVTPQAKVVQQPVKKQQPVYVSDDEQKVEVKFFLKELWTKIF